MKLKVKETKVNTELNWVIKIVNSVKTKDQLDVALKCFLLWDMKHSCEPRCEEKSMLKSKFWSIYKNKETNFFVGG